MSNIIKEFNIFKTMLQNNNIWLTLNKNIYILQNNNNIFKKNPQ